MSEEGDFYRAMRAYRRERGMHNRHAATGTLRQAQVLAFHHSMSLVQRSEAHYQLRHTRDGWLLNIYPGNQRLYTDPNQPKKAPYLSDHLPGDREWTLVDVVNAAVAKQGEK